MAVKIFCSACQQFIKDATRVELRSVTGEEICAECEKGVKNAFDEVEKSAKRAIVQIERTRDQAKVHLERLYKKVIKADE